MTIEAHYVPACSPPPEDAPAQLELVALGDFDRDNDSVAILASDASSRRLDLPQATRAATLETLGDGRFWGSGVAGARDRLPIVLWPRDRACPLARFELEPALAASTEPGAWLLGGSGRLEALLAFGPLGAGGASDWAFVDLSDASVATPDGAAPRSPRAGAALSELGDRLLRSGGLDPASGRASPAAELFDPALRRFDGSARALSTPRAHHAALGLPGGQSLLIGGVSEAGVPLRSVEVLSSDPARAARSFELLEQPRVAPRALLIARDRVLVGGGYRLSETGQRSPIERVEFLSTDLTDVAQPSIELAPAAFDRAFVALGSGGALAVGGCAPGAADDCIPCDGGCVSRDVWWIDPGGGPHALEPLPIELGAAAPKLVPAADGSPWLIADGRLGRFDPWLARFSPVDAGRPAADARVLAEPIAWRPGSFAWLEARPSGVELLGLHHSQRGAYAQDIAPLLVGSARGLVPHRPPTSGDGSVRLEYSPATGLTLAGAAAVVSIADTDYAAFTLELSVTAGPPPLLQLASTSGARAEAAFGGLDCPWPDERSTGESAAENDAEGAPAPGPAVRLRVQRTLDRVRLERLEGGVATEPRPEPCRRALPERVGIQLVGNPAGATRLDRIEIRRSVE